MRGLPFLGAYKFDSSRDWVGANATHNPVIGPKAIDAQIAPAEIAHARPVMT